MPDFDLTFAHTYEVEEVPELSGSGGDLPPIYIPPPPLRSRQEHDGLWLKISASEGTSWVGVFAFGYQAPPAISRVVSLPDSERLCVISRGAAYVVKAGQPESCETLPTFPVTGVHVAPEDELVILADFSRLTAYGRKGVVWRSARLCWDELTIDGLEHGIIAGRGYDPGAVNGESTFKVHLQTGNVLSMRSGAWV